MPTPGSIHDDLLVLRCQGGDERAFAALVSRWQEPLLKYLEDFAVDEIAEILSLPEGTVKSRLHHARKQLKQLMEKEDGPA